MLCYNTAVSPPETHMSRVLLCLILLFTAQNGSANYITDKLLAGFYASPDLASQPLRALPSGTPMEVLEEKANFSRVRLGDNSQGWVETRFITQEKPAKMMLLELQAKYATLKRQGNGNEQPEKQQDEPPVNPSPPAEQSPVETQPRVQTSAAEEPQITADSKSIHQQLSQENRFLRDRLQQIRRLVSDTSEEETQAPSDTLHPWVYMLIMLGMLLSFIAGIAFKNYRIARRVGETGQDG